jgi:hypothetical protein
VEEVAQVAAQNRSLTELRSIGPFIDRQIRSWLDKPPQSNKKAPEIRRDFISMAEAKRALARKTGWPKNLRGDLQMHTCWSDGSGTIAEMAEAATKRSYEYIGITDHSQGLKIAGGIDEQKQGKEIVKLNLLNRKSGQDLVVLRYVEMTSADAAKATCLLSPYPPWIWFWAHFILLCGELKTKPTVILSRRTIPTFKFSVIRAAASIIIDSV